MKILVGLSGGLDSTYAAYILKQAGHEVVGGIAVMHEYTDVSSAISSANEVGIPYVIIDRQAEFQSYVVSDFISAYTSGKTPNPCVVCNPKIKFAALCDYAWDNGFDKVSTGHYSSVCYENGRYFIKRADDGSKDQSYVLWGLSQEQLSMLCLPLAGMKKSEIRLEAEKLGFTSADAPESQENCFIPDDDYVGFIKSNTDKSFPEGNFIDRDGNVLGKHKGIINYTVGQRKGLGIALGEPMFVSYLDAESNTVTLVRAGEEYFTGMTVSNLSFMKMLPTECGTVSAGVKVRYSAKPIPCTVNFSGNCASVIFSSPIRAVTPGQSAVFYDGNDLLFGGIIDGGTGTPKEAS